MADVVAVQVVSRTCQYVTEEVGSVVKMIDHASATARAVPHCQCQRRNDPGLGQSWQWFFQRNTSEARHHIASHGCLECICGNIATHFGSSIDLTARKG
jgi:hypothetical protein